MQLISEQKEVCLFLSQLKTILQSPKFNLDTDLDILMKKKNEDPCDPFTTENTLSELAFDSIDVVRELLKIEICNYVETVTDNKNPSFPPFFVFRREINKKEVYIKVKIRDKLNNKVFCVSFHFARHPFQKPLPYES